jgi:multiple sugar transport system permease protein
MRKTSVPYILVSPLLIAFVVLIGFPLYKVLETSFYKASFLNPQVRLFVGFSNYQWLFNFKYPNPKVSYFVGAFGRSLLWVGCSVALKVVVGLLAAILLDSPYLIGKKIYRSLLIIPWAIPWAMAAMMWAWTLNPQFGIVNSILLRLGLTDSPISFLSTPTSAFIATFVVDAWAGMPFMVIMFLSGLQSIPSSLYEAARLDGANEWRQLFKITIPMIRPVILTVSLLSMVWTFNSFDIIWVLTQGGPLRSTETLPIAIYNTSFRMLRFGGIGKASAMTIAQVLLVTIISIFYIRTMRESETA